MKDETVTTVQKVIERPLFEKARVMGGHKGLNRRVRWAHILEVQEFESLLHGGEFILTTGIGLQFNTSSKLTYMEKLIECGAACLCIEMGQYFEYIPEAMIELANKHDFPLLAFQGVVHFVDITQDIHSFIINQHHEMLQKLEGISRDLNHLTLTSQGIQKILQLLHESTHEIVMYMPQTGGLRVYPSITEKQKNDIKHMAQRRIDQFEQALHQDEQQPVEPVHWQEQGQHFLLQPVRAMGQIWAYVTLVLQKREPDEFKLLVLDRASVALAQDLLRKNYMEEKKLHAENLWVGDLIHHRLQSEDHIKSLLGFNSVDRFDYRVCIIEIANNDVFDQEELESDRLHISLLARSVFEQHGFHIVMTTNSNHLIIVVIDVTSHSFNRARFHKVLTKLKEVSQKKEKDRETFHLAVGGSYNHFMEAYLSYQEAKFVLVFTGLQEDSSSVYYEDLGIYRLLLPIKNEKYVHKFVTDHLGPLIEHDQHKNSHLLLTLNVYLDNKGSKKETAEKLFIVRQTLYHRLEKIEQLLGTDFSNSEQRLSLEVALRAYQLVHTNPFE